MADWIDIRKDSAHVAREKEKARQLRRSAWWRSLLDSGACHYCKHKFSPDELTMDHVLPLSRGGKSTRGNIVVCCKECNSRKKYMTPAEMIMENLGVDEAPEPGEKPPQGSR